MQVWWLLGFVRRLWCRRVRNYSTSVRIHLHAALGIVASRGWLLASNTKVANSIFRWSNVDFYARASTFTRHCAAWIGVMRIRQISVRWNSAFLLLTHSLTAALDQLRVVASSTSNDPGPQSRQHQQIGISATPLLIYKFNRAYLATLQALPISSGNTWKAEPIISEQLISSWQLNQISTLLTK